MRRVAALLSAVALAALAGPPASADPNPAVRELTCVAEDGTTTTFIGQQVRRGTATPSIWRSVSGSDPAGFNLHGIKLVDPETGEVLEDFGNTQGVDHHFALVTCSVFVPIGPNTGRLVSFEGFFVPAN